MRFLCVDVGTCTFFSRPYAIAVQDYVKSYSSIFLLMNICLADVFPVYFSIIVMLPRTFFSLSLAARAKCLLGYISKSITSGSQGTLVFQCNG